MDFASLLVVLFGAVAASVASGGLDAIERRRVLLAFAAHVAAAGAHWASVEFWYSGDMSGYQGTGYDLARFLDADFVRFAPEVVKYALHLESALPQLGGEGQSTGTAKALAGFIVFVVGPSSLSLCLAASWLSWFGQLCLYRVARAELDPADRPTALLGLFFVPSVMFWSSGYTKESLVVGFLGLLCLSTYGVLRLRKPPHIAGLLVGGVGIAMLKSFTLIPYLLGVIVFVYADRAWRRAGKIRIRPAYLLLAAVLAMGGIAAMGSLFPSLGINRIAETIAEHQQNWHDVQGGSDVEQGSGEARSLPQQLRFVPLALVNALFRPMIFDAKNVFAALAAFENTLLLLAVLSLLRPRFRGAIIESIARAPFLAFSATFVLVFATGVGLTTSNLGSLSRYRMPMMPFYAATVLVLRRRARASELLAPGRSRLAAFRKPALRRATGDVRTEVAPLTARRE
jgi:hypothetical protein